MFEMNCNRCSGIFRGRRVATKSSRSKRARSATRRMVFSVHRAPTRGSVQNSLLAQIGYRSGKTVDLVTLAANITGLRSDENSNPGGPASGFPNFVLGYHDCLGFSVNINGDSFFAAAIDDAVSLNPVPVRGERLVPAAKMDARLAAPTNVIIPNEVVGIAVTKG